MKVRYIGKSFGVEGLTNGEVYECIAIEDGMLRIVDDSEDEGGYLYSAIEPASIEFSELCGKWEIVEDNENNDLAKIIK